MKKVELVREVDPTEDGRLISAGATTWDDPLPVESWDEGIIGFVNNIRREGHRIVGDCNLNLDYVSADGIAGMIDTSIEGYAAFSSYRIKAVRPCTSEQYPWKDTK